MYQKSISKKSEIIEAAKNVFSEKGYSAVTMKDISDACKIGRSSLYHYFSSVDEIYNEVLANSKLQENVDEIFVSEFLEILKNELISLDKSLYRAVAEYLLAKKAI